MCKILSSKEIEEAKRWKREFDAAREQEQFLHIDFVEEITDTELHRKETWELEKANILKESPALNQPTDKIPRTITEILKKSPSGKARAEAAELNIGNQQNPAPPGQFMKRSRKNKSIKKEPKLQLRQIANTTQKLTDVFTPIEDKNILGAGASGRVYKVSRIEDGIAVALKVLSFA